MEIVAKKKGCMMCGLAVGILEEIEPGERVLDIGCGAGVDALLAAMKVGDSGSVLGIDMTAEMILKAVENQQALQAANITFREAGVEDLSATAGHFDVAISNGVFNLIPDKEAALEAVFHLLKPGGDFSWRISS